MNKVELALRSSMRRRPASTTVLTASVRSPISDGLKRRLFHKVGVMGAVVIRAMSGQDVDRCGELFDAAIARLRLDLGLGGGDGARGGAVARIAHLLSSDPADSLIAVAGDTVIGFAQAARRGNCWMLAHLFIDPGRQSSGIGGALLATLHSRGDDLPVGLIGSTADPRAMRAYARLPGFRLHPTVRAEGTVVVVPTPRLQPEVGGPDDFEAAAAIDVAVRGSTRKSDLLHLLTEGHELRFIPGRGYIVATGTSVATLAALDHEAASALLEDALSRAVGAELELPRMTSNQQWAISIAVAAGLHLRPWGPFMVRGLEHPPSPYLPHPALN